MPWPAPGRRKRLHKRGGEAGASCCAPASVCAGFSGAAVHMPPTVRSAVARKSLRRFGIMGTALGKGMPRCAIWNAAFVPPAAILLVSVHIVEYSTKLHMEDICLRQNTEV